MERDVERLESIRAALRQADLDALVCTLPTNVLLLSGYWPVVGTSVALVTRNGRCVLLVPEGERPLAELGWADEVQTFAAGSLKDLHSGAEAVGPLLAEAARRLGLKGGRIGCETGETYEPSSYSSLHLYGNTLLSAVGQAAGLPSDGRPAACPTAVDGLLAELRATLTAHERGRLALPVVPLALLSREAGRSCVPAWPKWRWPICFVPPCPRALSAGKASIVPMVSSGACRGRTRRRPTPPLPARRSAH